MKRVWEFFGLVLLITLGSTCCCLKDYKCKQTKTSMEKQGLYLKKKKKDRCALCHFPAVSQVDRASRKGSKAGEFRLTACKRCFQAQEIVVLRRFHVFQPSARSGGRSVKLNTSSKERRRGGQLQPRLFLISRFKSGRFNCSLD